MPYTVTKTWRDLPAAHRQPNHDGHCRLIHGHNWRFDVCFTCDALDGNGFVIDVGKLEFVKTFLAGHFDHTLVLNDDDPQKENLLSTIGLTTGNVGFARIIVVPNCGMEGLAKYVFGEVERMMNMRWPDAYHDRGLRVVGVQCWEDSKNRCNYKPPTRE